MPLAKKLVAEFIGTGWLVLGGCGSAVLTGAIWGPTDHFPYGISFLGIALAFGLSLLTMAYTIGSISGCHINPAVSVGLWVGGRLSPAELIPYIIAQVLGGIAGAAILYAILTGKGGGLTDIGRFAANGYGEHSPDHYSLGAGFICEVVMTYVFLLVILGSTDARAPAGFAGLAIGLSLVLIHLISIPVTATSVNPARSTSQAVILFLNKSDWAIQQLWLFWVAPILGALSAGLTYRWLFSTED
jgi:aquaporin Z